jgi:hypothetical protein
MVGREMKEKDSTSPGRLSLVRSGQIAPILAGLLCVSPFSCAYAALQISSAASSNIVCSGKNNICTATARNAVLNAQHLARLLARHDVTVSSGKIAKDVVLATSFSWISAYALTLDAYNSVRLDHVLTIAGPGALTLRTNDGGLNGGLSFHREGRVAFDALTNTLVLNKTGYSLEGSVAELASAIAANPSGNYALANNYDASTDGVYSASPILTSLSGTLEGLGNAISNLAIDDQTEGDRVGLIRQLSASGIVSDMRLTNVNVSTGAKSVVGALVAINAGGTVEGSNSAEVISAGDKSAAGGLVGFNQGGFYKTRFLEPVVSGCHATGSVTAGKAAYAVGGLIGANNGIVIASSASGDVSAGKNSFVGGLVGYTEKTIEQSYATGSASGDVGAAVGGVAGGVFFGAIIQSYAYVTVDAAGTKKAGGAVGGLVGYDEGQIVESYSAGMVSGTKSSVGGLVGIDISNGNTFTSYWDFDTSGITDPSEGAGNIPNDPGITGLSNSQFQSALPPYFDPAVWAENPSVNGGLPYLIGNPPS